MTLYFPNMTMKRYTYTSNKTGVYGEQVHGYTLADTIRVDFQHENNQEYAKAYGVERQNLYKIYTTLDTVIEDSDVLVDEDNHQYQIIGEVQDYNHFHDYRRVHLVRSRGDKVCQ